MMAWLDTAPGAQTSRGALVLSAARAGAPAPVPGARYAALLVGVLLGLLLGLVVVPMTPLGQLRGPGREVAWHPAAAAVGNAGGAGQAGAATPSDLLHGGLPAGQQYVAPPPLTLADLQRPRNRNRADPATYQAEVPDEAMRSQLAKVRTYLGSQAFKDAQAARLQGPRRGIIINAGGRMLAGAIVQLKVLRQAHNCSLPVELVWQGSQEMDNATWQALQREFGPLRGYDITTEPYPPHHRAVPANAQINGRGWMYKAMSIARSHFQEVLLLDSDNTPLQDPELLFDAPDYQTYGNMFWPDFWRSGTYKAQLYAMLGLVYEKTLPLLLEGQGGLAGRDTESGQLLINLNMHADVAEALFWVSSFADTVYKQSWGDKDTYPLAFAVAGKADMFTQSQVPPGVAATFGRGLIRVKASDAVMDGHKLFGMVHFDWLGRAALLHLTLGEYQKGRAPPSLDLLTAPIPHRWAKWYFTEKPQGPYIGVDVWDHVLAPEALHVWQANPAPLASYVAAGGCEGAGCYRVQPADQGCPAAQYLAYRRMRTLGVPVGPSRELEEACAGLLASVLGPEGYAAAEAAGTLAHPEIAALAPVMARAPPAEAAAGGPAAAAISGFEQVAARADGGGEVGEGTPVAAWVPDPALHTPLTAAIAEASWAFQWLNEHADMFPVLLHSGR